MAIGEPEASNPFRKRVRSRWVDISSAICAVSTVAAATALFVAFDTAGSLIGLGVLGPLAFWFIARPFAAHIVDSVLTRRHRVLAGMFAFVLLVTMYGCVATGAYLLSFVTVSAFSTGAVLWGLGFALGFPAIVRFIVWPVCETLLSSFD